MQIKISNGLQQSINELVRARITDSLVLNVMTAAEEIRRKHEDQNVALEDIADMVARAAVQSGCTVEFSDRSASLIEKRAALS